MPTLERLLERAIVSALIRECDAAGFVTHAVDDGGDEDQPATTPAEALEAVFAVDEARLRFKAKDDASDEPRLYNVLLIGGNGCDIISDWHCGNASFDRAVNDVAMNIDDLVTVSLKKFERCTSSSGGKRCTRPEGHPHSLRAYDKEFHESGSPDYVRW